MHILVINPGSSSIKFSLFAEDRSELRSVYEGELSGIGSATTKLEFHDASGKDLSSACGQVKADSMEAAISVVECAVGTDGLPSPDAVGYRVVHPGAQLRGHQRLTPDVLRQLRAAVAFAPLHDPAALQIIDEMMQRLPSIPHFACFDTVFHETMPEEAYVYPLPEALRAQGVRRYGFHGLSCESIVIQMRDAHLAAGESGVAFPRRMVIAHLGSGCSITACIDGRSVDTTMGLTPTGGVVMGTRPGDLDPGLVLYLLRQPGATVASVEGMLNHDSGLKALGGANDMRQLREAAKADPRARLAIRIFSRSVVKAIAGFIALYGADAIVFTGGIGEHDAASRSEIADGVAAFGVQLNVAANRHQPPQPNDNSLKVRKISAATSQVAVYVAPAQEDLTIARHVARLCRASQPSSPESP